MRIQRTLFFSIYTTTTPKLMQEKVSFVGRNLLLLTYYMDSPEAGSFGMATAAVAAGRASPCSCCWPDLTRKFADACSIQDIGRETSAAELRASLSPLVSVLPPASHLAAVTLA